MAQHNSEGRELFKLKAVKVGNLCKRSSNTGQGRERGYRFDAPANSCSQVRSSRYTVDGLDGLGACCTVPDTSNPAELNHASFISIQTKLD